VFSLLYQLPEAVWKEFSLSFQLFSFSAIFLVGQSYSIIQKEQLPGAHFSDSNAGLGSDDLWTANRPYSCFHRAWEEVPETAFYQTLKFGVVLSAFLHL